MMLNCALILMSFIHSAVASPELRVEDTRLVDRSGRTVILRGVNVSNRSKVPPFLPFLTRDGLELKRLDPLPALGLNVIRLLLVWEAYEPAPDVFDEGYVDRLAEIADAAWARGIYTIVDLHQDSFSRYVGTGCGAGFPAWASGSKPDPLPPRNCGQMWPVKVALSSQMHRAFHDFWSDRLGSRTRLLEAWRRLARRFRGHPGVVGYDVLNEPWGWEDTEISPFYEDAARAIRAEDPTSILFIEPHVLSAIGVPTGTRLKRPGFSNYVYSQHFYDALATVTKKYAPWNPVIDPSFQALTKPARDWNVPLFVGEFGAFATTGDVEKTTERQYDLLDGALASAAQWNYTPDWNPVDLDGWNGEDYSIVDERGDVRGNFLPRPYPARTAGRPLEFRINHGEFPAYRWNAVSLESRARDRAESIDFRWDHDPRLGATELFLPRSIYFPDRAPGILSDDPALKCDWDGSGMFLACSSPVKGTKSLRVYRRSI